MKTGPVGGLTGGRAGRSKLDRRTPAIDAPSDTGPRGPRPTGTNSPRCTPSRAPNAGLKPSLLAAQNLGRQVPDGSQPSRLREQSVALLVVR